MQTPSFRIVLYNTIAPSTTPETASYVAGLFIGYDTVPRWTCAGATADEATQKMETFWAEERKAHEPRQRPKKAAEGVDAAMESAPAPEPVDEDFDVV